MLPAKTWSLLEILAVIENIKNKHFSKLITLVIPVLMYCPSEGDFCCHSKQQGLILFLWKNSSDSKSETKWRCKYDFSWLSEVSVAKN